MEAADRTRTSSAWGVLTRAVTLSPGDIVTTGTPGGSAIGTPGLGYLHPGDVVEASLTGVGAVTSRVERAW